MLVLLWFFGYLALGQRLCLHLQIDLGIDVGSTQRDMAQPAAYRVDINASPQQMGRGRLSNDVGLTCLAAIEGMSNAALSIALDQVVDAAACVRLETTGKKHMLRERRERWLTNVPVLFTRGNLNVFGYR